MESVKDMWQLVCEQIKKNVSEVIYDIWIKPLEIISFDGTKVELAASSLMKTTIEKQFFGEIKSAFREVLGFDAEIVLVNPADTKVEKVSEQKPVAAQMSIEQNTFENFVVGSSNRFAHAAAQAVAAAPGNAYNPLFIYGNSGLGKTHLLRAIGNEIKKNNPQADIIITGGEDFVNLIVGGITANNMNGIHDKYRNCDVLLVDDIQFIAGKESTQ